MAVATGTPIRPELSAVDYTPFLQAAGQSAQMQAQGVAALGAGLTKGFESYVQNKEKEKQAQGIIKAADVLSSGFEPILDKIDPKIGSALQDLRSRISDPNLSTVERATAAKSFMENAPTLMNAGVRFLEGQQALEVRKAESQIKMDELKRKNATSALARTIALGEAVPQGIPADMMNDAIVQAATMREKAQMTERIDKVVDGKTVPFQVTTNLLTGKKTESQIREPYMSEEATARLESQKGMIGLGIKEIEKTSTEVESATSMAELADQMVYAIEQGAITGPFAEAAVPVLNLAENIFGKDYNAAVQKLFVQGARGLSGLQIRALMKGLGAMSNDDRVAAEKAFLSAKDPKQAVLYFAELVKLNKERAESRQAFVDDMLKNGMTADKIKIELSKLRKEEPSISSLARDRIFGTAKEAPAPAVPQIAPVGGINLNAVKAEIERRKAAQKK